jgi:pimeloyl-ACP methyl ester carboxylesterase
MLVIVETKGCELHANVEGVGEPVVFIQGVGVHGDGWLPQTEELQAEFRCVTFDNRGMGLSQPPGCALTVAQMAEDALTLMDAAGIDSAHIVGHSLGGAIALEVALLAQDRVRSLALLCTSARGSDATRPTAKMVWLGMRSRVGTRRMRSNAFLEIVMPADYLAAHDRDALSERLRPLFGHALWDTPDIVMPQLKALKEFDAEGRLDQLAGMPTLVVSAAHDLIFPPECGRRLASAIPGARYVKIADAAHGVPLQSPDVINRLLVEHLTDAGR